MKINIFGNKQASVSSKPPQNSITQKQVAIGLLASVLVGAGLAAYSVSDHSALKTALSIEQDLYLYSSQENDEALNLKVTSIFDRQFAFAPEGLREGNVSFMRDSVINRHELACGRDQAYMKEFAAQGRTYLGCSITPRSGVDGVFINTYSIGEEFSASYARHSYGENTEYRTDIVFPRDFKAQVEEVAGQKFSLDLARLAVDLKIRARGRTLDFDDQNDQAILKSVLKEGAYSERWVAQGGVIDDLWKGLEKIGSVGTKSGVNYAEVTKNLTEYDLNEDTLRFVSSVQLETMAKMVEEMDANPAIAAIRANLDHNCGFKADKTTSKGFADHNNECAQDLGIHRSLQLKYELDKAKPVDMAGTVHGQVKNRVILGSYKGHPVIGNVGNLESDTLAYVPVPQKTQGWQDLFISNVYSEDTQEAPENDETSGAVAAKALHFNHGYAPHHTPIVVGPEMAKVFNLGSLDEESRNLIMEMTLEHEIKHIKDYALFKATGEGTLNKSYETQQAACDIYAVEVMAKKYDDPQVLTKLRDALLLRGEGFHQSFGIEAQKMMEGAGRLKQAVTFAAEKLSQVESNHRQNTVLKILDQRIEDLKLRSIPPGNWAPRVENDTPPGNWGDRADTPKKVSQSGPGF